MHHHYSTLFTLLFVATNKVNKVFAYIEYSEATKV